MLGGPLCGCDFPFAGLFEIVFLDGEIVKAMVLTKIGPVDRSRVPLELVDRPIPIPGDKEILVRVTACGVCHTELDEIEGRTLPPGLPVIPGHQVIGRVEKRGPWQKNYKKGTEWE